jgi:hypothetical protein
VATDSTRAHDHLTNVLMDPRDSPAAARRLVVGWVRFVRTPAEYGLAWGAVSASGGPHENQNERASGARSTMVKPYLSELGQHRCWRT